MILKTKKIVTVNLISFTVVHIQSHSQDFESERNEKGRSNGKHLYKN